MGKSLYFLRYFTLFLWWPFLGPQGRGKRRDRGEETGRHFSLQLSPYESRKLLLQKKKEHNIMATFSCQEGYEFFSMERFFPGPLTVVLCLTS